MPRPAELVDLGKGMGREDLGLHDDSKVCTVSRVVPARSRRYGNALELPRLTTLT